MMYNVSRESTMVAPRRPPANTNAQFNYFTLQQDFQQILHRGHASETTPPSRGLTGVKTFSGFFFLFLF